MYCTKCGATLPGDGSPCAKCAAAAAARAVQPAAVYPAQPVAKPKKKLKTGAIIAIVAGAVVLVGVLAVTALVIGLSAFSSSAQGKTMDQISGHDWIGGDGSLLRLRQDGSFSFYKDPDITDDNYKAGTYRVYQGADALSFVSDSLSEYGLTYEEQFQYIYQLSGSNSKNMLKQYYCYVLYHDEFMLDGEAQTPPQDMPFVGFYSEENKTLDVLSLSSVIQHTYTRQD